MIWVAELTIKAVAAVPPNVTPVAPVNPVPVMTTEVPPATGPLVGLRLVTVGTATYVNWTASRLEPPGVLTMTV